MKNNSYSGVPPGRQDHHTHGRSGADASVLPVLPDIVQLKSNLNDKLKSLKKYHIPEVNLYRISMQEWQYYHSSSQISRADNSLFALKKVSWLTKIPPPLFIITLYFLQGDPFICDQFLWTHWQHWGYCVVCNHEKTAEVPSTNANAFCIWLILRYIEFHALRLTQSKFNFSFPIRYCMRCI